MAAKAETWATKAVTPKPTRPQPGPPTKPLFAFVKYKSSNALFLYVIIVKLDRIFF